MTEESESQDDAQGSKSFNDDVEKSHMRSDNIDTDTGIFDSCLLCLWCLYVVFIPVMTER